MGRESYFARKADEDRDRKDHVIHHQRRDDEAFIRATFTITEEDRRLLAQHRVDTGESASAFLRRMIAGELR